MKKIMTLISLCMLLVLTSCNITLTKHEVKITGDVITKEYKDIKGTILEIKDVYLKSKTANLYEEKDCNIRRNNAQDDAPRQGAHHAR